MPYVYELDVDTSFYLFVYADVAPHGREVELQRASARQEPERLSRGERRRREDDTVQPAEPERVVRRCRFDDPSAGPSHAPLAAAGVDFEDIRRHLEVVLRDVPEGIWSHIQDEDLLEQCVGVSSPWRAIVRRASVAAALTNGRLLSGREGSVGGGPPPPRARGGGPPLPEGGAGGGALEAP
jgi:hypothetical protein